MDAAPDIDSLTERVREEGAFAQAIISEVEKVVVGQKYMVERIAIGLLCGGHCLVEGVPGLAKTLTIKTLAATLDARFSRVQFTPDLLPADITGTTIYNMQTGEFTQKRGPLFANLLLADEINRAPAKVQSALLEAMGERQVTIGEKTEALPDPFLVLATQNPLEQEGTYPLPEAQLDRFMLMLRIEYPSKNEERQILDRMAAPTPPQAQRVASIQSVLSARKVVSEVYIDESIRDYIVAITHATRDPGEVGLPELATLIACGASPRATIYLAQAARAHAFLRARGFVTPEDVRAVGPDVLRHRVTVSYEAEAEDVASDDVIMRLFERVEVP